MKAFPQTCFIECSISKFGGYVYLKQKFQVESLWCTELQKVILSCTSVKA